MNQQQVTGEIPSLRAPQVLVVDDDRAMRSALEARFSRRDWRVETAGTTAEAMGKFRRQRHALIVSDVRMPGDDGIALLRQARSLSPRTAVILLTAFASVPEAVTAIKDGACEYLIKPVSFEQLEQAAARVLAAHGAANVGGNHAGNPGGNHGELEGLAGHSPAWLQALERARQAAGTTADILIEAESGTGKERVARLIHRWSARRDRTFVAVNCAAFPEALLESELFGHAKGAFTGADHAKPGKFELASGGTLLLDEVGDMPLGLQPKLLRVLQERELDRLGDTRTVPVDLRVIATTNRSLMERIAEGQFRSDLYYRLNVIPLTLPPLRDRPSDIRELASHFAALYAAPGPAPRLSEELLHRLESHHWPGNVRELANCLRRVLALSPGSEIGTEALDGYAWSATNISDNRLRPGLKVEEMERRLFAMTLEATGGNRSRAAELLGVSLRTVRNKVRCYSLPRWESKSGGEILRGEEPLV